MDLLEFMMGLDIEYYLVLKNMIPFTIELDILLAIKAALHMLFLLTMKKSRLILMILNL